MAGSMRFFQAEYQYYTKRDFTLEKPLKDFEDIGNAQLLETDGIDEARASKNECVLFASNQTSPGAEAFVFLSEA